MFRWFPAFLELMNTFTISIRMWDFMGTQIFVYLGLQFIRSCRLFCGAAVACDSGSSQRRPASPRARCVPPPPGGLTRAACSSRPALPRTSAVCCSAIGQSF